MHERIDAALAIERRPLPVALEIAPLNKLPAGIPQPLDRAVLVARGARPESREARTPKRALNPLGRIRELFLKPCLKRRIVQAARLRLGEHRKQRIDARLDRTLAEQVGAEAVNRADLRFFEPANGVRPAARAPWIPQPPRCAILRALLEA